MIPPLVLAVGALGLGWLGYKKLARPAPGKIVPGVEYQGQAVVSASGAPVHVLVPLAPVTANQKAGIATPAAPSTVAHKPAPAVAQTMAGGEIVYAPPKMVDTMSPGSVVLAPIVVTSTGSSSVAIGTLADIQRALNTLGFQPALKEDGKFGPATAQNIRAFQSRNGLVVDGNAGPATKAALSNVLANFVSGGSSASVGPAVAAAAAAGTPPTISTLLDIQRGLNALGATPPLLADGKAGPKTVAAIRSFQMSHGLVVDGVAGTKTKLAIGIALGNSGGRPVVPAPATPPVRGSRGGTSGSWASLNKPTAPVRGGRGQQRT